MRGAAIAAFIVFGIWIIAVVVPVSCSDLIRQMANSFCDAQGRDLYSVNVGYPIHYRCGNKKKAPPSLGRP